MCRPQRYFDSCATIRKKNYTQNFPRQVSNNIASCVAHFYCKQIKMIFFFFMRQIQRLVNFRLPISSIIMVTSTAVLKEYMISKSIFLFLFKRDEIRSIVFSKQHCFLHARPTWIHGRGLYPLQPLVLLPVACRAQRVKDNLNKGGLEF